MSSVQINNGSTVIGEITHDGTSLILQSKNGAPLKLKDASGNVLFDSQAPVTNSKRVVAEYIFDADQSLDYVSSFAPATTITFSELPTNTIAVWIHWEIERPGNYAGWYTKRNSSDTEKIELLAGRYAETSAFNSILWLPTDGNSIYIDAVYGTKKTFKVFGYKVAE